MNNQSAYTRAGVDLAAGQKATDLMKTAVQVETLHSLETTLENIFIEVTGQELTA